MVAVRTGRSYAVSNHAAEDKDSWEDELLATDVMSEWESAAASALESPESEAAPESAFDANDDHVQDESTVTDAEDVPSGTVDAEFEVTEDAFSDSKVGDLGQEPVEETVAVSLPEPAPEADNAKVYAAVTRAQRALAVIGVQKLYAEHADEVTVIVDTGKKLLGDLRKLLPDD